MSDLFPADRLFGKCASMHIHMNLRVPLVVTEGVPHLCSMESTWHALRVIESASVLGGFVAWVSFRSLRLEQPVG